MGEEWSRDTGELRWPLWTETIRPRNLRGLHGFGPRGGERGLSGQQAAHTLQGCGGGGGQKRGVEFQAVMELGSFSGSGWGWSPRLPDWPWGGGVLSISQPPVLCFLRVGSGGGGGLWLCLHPTPLAFILTLLLRVISLALFLFLGSRREREAARLGRGAGGGSWSNRPALEKWLLFLGGFS